MSDQCHSLLKEHANAWNMTKPEVMHECTRHHIHKHSNTCEYIDVLFRFKDVKKDKRLSKDCYSCVCFFLQPHHELQNRGLPGELGNKSRP